MKIFFKHIIRNIKENVGRTSLIIISLFGVGLILSISLGMVFSFKSLVDSLSKSLTGGYNVMVYSSTEEALTEDKINSVGVEFEKLGVGTYNYGYIKDKDDKFISSPLLGLDITQAVSMKLVEIEKAKDIKLKDYEVIISNQFASKNKLKVKDKFNYYDEDGNTHEFKIKYIAKDAGAFLHDLSIVTNNNTYKKISNVDVIKYDFFCLKYSGSKDLAILAKELNDIEDNYGLDFQIEEMPTVMEVTGDIIKVGLLIIILILVVVYFTLNSIVKIIISERIPIIGSFRSVGASVSKMNFILLLEMAMYGIFGGLLGAVAGVLFIKTLYLAFELVGDILGISIEMQSYGSYGFLVVFTTVLLLVIFQISLSIGDILRTTKISIKDCIFNKHESIYKYSNKKLLIGVLFLLIGIVSFIFSSKLNFIFAIISILSLFISIALLLPSITKFLSRYLDKVDSPVFHMAKNTIINNKLQINTNVIVSIMMCVSLLSFAALDCSIKDFEGKKDMVKTDIYALSSAEPVSVTNDLRALDGVERVSVLYTDDFSYYYDSIIFANNKVDKLLFIYSDDYKSLVEDSGVLDVDYNLANNLKLNEVILSNVFKDKYKLKVGDVIVLNCVSEEERFKVDMPMNLKIVGFANTNNINPLGIIVSEEIVDDTVTLFSSNEYFISLKDKNNLKDVKKEVKKALTYQMPEVYSQKEYVEFINENKKMLYETIIEVILIIIGVSLIGIINNQTVSFLERKREMAVLYSTSMSRAQLNKMIFTEVIMSYAISAGVSIIFTILFIKLLKQTLMMLNIYYPLSFSIISILVLLFIIGIIMMVIYLVMKRKIKKMNIVEELKYE